MKPDPVRVGASAGALIRDDEGRVLMVNPTYKPYWNLPGGHVDEGETPHAACVREIREELGLDLPVGKLIATVWLAREGSRPHLYFIFDGGRLDHEQQQAITLQASELSEYRFCPPDTTDPALMPAHSRSVWETVTHALATGRHAYVEVVG